MQDTSDKPKIQKYIGMLGGASRRQAESLIRQGRIRVNNQVATIGMRINPSTDSVTIDGKPLTNSQKTKIFLVNKPIGFVSTTSDELGRRTVLDILPAKITHQYRLFPVGRLDMDAEGLLILTNDGQLAQHYTHPSFQVEKRYLVVLDRSMSQVALDHLAKGVRLQDGWAKPKNVDHQVVDRVSQVELSLYEGRNHEVKRIFKRLGYEVVRLIRLKMGEYNLDMLQDQNWIEIS